MSTHRIRDVEYDEDDLYDDDYDDYDEGAHGNEGISAEDDGECGVNALKSMDGLTKGNSALEVGHGGSQRCAERRARPTPQRAGRDGMALLLRRRQVDILLAE